MRVRKTITFGWFLLAFSLGCSQGRHGNDFYVPKGYVGWVSLDYGISGAAPLPVEGGRRIIRFQTPRLATSSPYEVGSAVDHYYYYDPANKIEELPTPFNDEGRKIWGEVTGFNNNKTTWWFFVGTESEFKAKNEWPYTPPR